MAAPGRVAVVPARGGSKRIPRKNIREFRGRPLLARTLETVLGSGAFDRVVVSTDDDEVAEVALACGAEVPFRRPDELSGDHVATAPVIAHAIHELERLGGRATAVCAVYPAAVFVTRDDLERAGAALLEDPALAYVATATTYAAPVQRCIEVGADGHATMSHPEHLSTRSQDLPERFHDAGQFYWGRRDAWVNGARVFDAPTRLHVLPRWRVQDIDTHEDWVRAELLHAQLEDLG